MDTEKEIWRPVAGWPGYEVSNLGSVKSYKKNKKAGRLLTVFNHRDGYRVVYLSIGRTAFQKFIHRLVAKAFIPNPENKKQVNHIDGDKANNYVSNLEWNTRSENLLHAFRIGLKVGLNGSDNPVAKLTEAQVLEMRGDYAKGGVGQVEMGKRYGVSQAVVSDILLRKRWTHI